jgi:diacylglycerol kinase family enzyme
MQSAANSRVSRRVAAGLTLLLFGLLGVAAVVLALSNVLPLLIAWIGMVVVIVGASYELGSSASRRSVWRGIIVLGAIVAIGSLVWLGWSSPWVLLGAIVAVSAIGFLGSYALDIPAPVVGRLSADHPVLFVNPKSGGGKATDADIAAIAAERGIEVKILERGDDLTGLATAAIAGGADAIATAGGDGSLGYVASETIDAGIPFICIPAGTRNHFARDLGLDRSDIVGALDAFNGEIRMLDYATVNGRVFLNVASLGLYAETVSDPAYRDAKVETARGTLQSLKASGMSFDLQYSDRNGQRHDSADLIMVSSGTYAVKGPPGDIGKREYLDQGHLGVITLNAPDPAAAIEVATLWAVGAIDRFRGWDQWQTSTFTVESNSSVSIGIDGETVSMEPPLHFEIHSGAFPVAVPEGTPHGPRVSPIGTIGSIRNLWAIAVGGTSNRASAAS